MGEASTTFRLVRCPKCENLLPELPEFSVYQCGGCGAVLRGTEKTNPPTSDDSGVDSFEKADSEGRDSSQRRQERESRVNLLSAYRRWRPSRRLWESSRSRTGL